MDWSPMKIGICGRATLALMLIGVNVAWQVRADDAPEAVGAEEAKKKLNDLIEKSVDWYDVLPDASAKSPLRAERVMRWRNVPREQPGEPMIEAIMVVWVHNGRPEAMASIYPWDGFLHHEFGSLSRANKLVVRNHEAIVWAPGAAGVEFKNVPDAPAPAAMPAARLRQMKAIGERFKGTMTGWKGDDSDREELRLLPRFLFRYDIEGARGSNPNLVDGAMFAFVLGTDPEIVLLLEAVGPKDEAVWQFALARATSGGLEVRLDGKVVWTAAKFPPLDGLTSPQRTLRRPLVE